MATHSIDPRSGQFPPANGPSARDPNLAPMAYPLPFHSLLAARNSLLSTLQTGELCRQKCTSATKVDATELPATVRAFPDS